MSDTEDDTPAPKAKKKGGKKKLVLICVLILALVGGGVGGWMYFNGSLTGAAAAANEPAGPRLVPKSEQKRASGDGEKGESGGGHGSKPPSGKGGEKYASNYYALDKEFTSNLLDSVHFIQVGVAISTPYDDSVIENIKTNEIAVRSAILMALGEASEEQVFSSEGKKQLQRRLVKAINDTLTEKEGFGGVGNVYFTNFVVQ